MLRGSRQDTENKIIDRQTIMRPEHVFWKVKNEKVTISRTSFMVGGFSERNPRDQRGTTVLIIGEALEQKWAKSMKEFNY